MRKTNNKIAVSIFFFACTILGTNFVANAELAPTKEQAKDASVLSQTDNQKVEPNISNLQELDGKIKLQEKLNKLLKLEKEAKELKAEPSIEVQSPQALPSGAIMAPQQALSPLLFINNAAPKIQSIFGSKKHYQAFLILEGGMHQKVKQGSRVNGGVIAKITSTAVYWRSKGEIIRLKFVGAQ